jgi:hypothetical protein
VPAGLRGLEQERLTVAEVLESHLRQLHTRRAKAADSIVCHVNPVKTALGMFRAVDLRTSDLEKYQANRLAAGMAPQTVDHKLGALRAALNLAKRQERLARTPFVPMLRPDNRRRGFFESADFRGGRREPSGSALRRRAVRARALSFVENCVRRGVVTANGRAQVTERTGGPSGTRTQDHWLKRPMLYQLS